MSLTINNNSQSNLAIDSMGGGIAAKWGFRSQGSRDIHVGYAHFREKYLILPELRTGILLMYTDVTERQVQSASSISHLKQKRRLRREPTWYPAVCPVSGVDSKLGLTMGSV